MQSVGPGTLLVSVPFLYDPNFFRTVVLLFQSSDEGTAGIVLNRPTSRKISELGGEFANQTFENDHSVYSGGPVEGPLMAIHSCLELGEALVLPKVFLSTSTSNLLELGNQSPERCRFVANYSGWGPGQLSEEIEAGGWLVIAGDESLVFCDPELLWKRLCERVGREVMLHPHLRDRAEGDPERN